MEGERLGNEGEGEGEVKETGGRYEKQEGGQK